VDRVLASIEREGIRWELVAAQERLAMAEKGLTSAKQELDAADSREEAVDDRLRAARHSADALDRDDPDAARLLEFVDSLGKEREVAEDDLSYAMARWQTAKEQVAAVRATVAQLEREMRGGERPGADPSAGA
jgi:multidrug resistance efflux pump